MEYSIWIISIFSLVTFFVFRDCQGIIRNPLKADKSRNTLRRRTPGCKLGGRFYGLEEEWHPRLEPYGVMNCIKCKCEPVFKKGSIRRKGSVSCRNINSECPEVNCPDGEPVLLPDQCCKTCVGRGSYLNNGAKDTKFMKDKYGMEQGLIVGDESKTEFISILVGDGFEEPVQTSGVARGRFSLRQSSLYYTLQYERLQEPRLMLLTDDKGDVLYEQDLSKNIYRRQRKICGVWQMLPSVFRKYLQQNKLYVVVTTEEYPDGEVRGIIKSHRALEDETFSSLLSTDSTIGVGGLAMFTLNPIENTLSFIVNLKGALKYEESKTTLVVSFLKDSSVSKEINVIMSKHDDEFSELWTQLTDKDSRQLARGKLTLEIRTERGVIISGKIGPRPTCDTLQAVMSGSEALEDNQQGAAASAIFKLDNDGKLHYKVHIVGLRSKLTSLTVEYADPSTQEPRRATNLRQSYVALENSFDGWANGTYTRAVALETYMLLRERMYINLETEEHGVSSLRGRIFSLPFNPFIDTFENPPTVLSASQTDSALVTGAAGHAWVLLSGTCALHYQIVVLGLDDKDTVPTSAFAQIGVYGELGDTSNKQLVKGFVGNVIASKTDNIDRSLLAALDAEGGFFQIATKEHPEGLLRGNITLPNKCHSGEYATVMEDGAANVVDDKERYRCMHKGSMYEDGDSWSAGEEACVSCSCRRGKVICHEAVCPKLECEDPVTVPGECCPQCVEKSNKKKDQDKPKKEDTTSKCYFEGDKKWHALGTTWHPYIPPFGYVTCALCSCQQGDGKTEVNCKKITCPPLTCPEADAYRRNESDCCRVCPEKKYKGPGDKPIQGDSPDAEPCNFGNSLIPDGSRWTPKVGDIGAIKCVSCRCKKGKIKCKKQKCPKLSCNKKDIITPKDRCCPICKTDGKTDTSSGSDGRKSKKKWKNKARMGKKGREKLRRRVNIFKPKQ